MIRLQNYKFGLGQESNMATITKNSKNIKSTFSPEPLDIIGYKLDRNGSGTLVFKFIKIKKTQQNKVTVTYFVFTSLFLLECQYFEKTWMYFVQI